MLDAATGAALQGDAALARRMMLATPSEALSGEDRRFRDCLVERFAPDATTAPTPELRGLAGNALRAFRVYWHEALTKPSSAGVAEQRLLRTMQAIMHRPDATTLDALSLDLEARLKAEGWWSLQGQTGRLRELMLWRAQEERHLQVVLPEGRSLTSVVLLRDFASLGWGDYSTCGRRGAGGWATRERLFAVVPRYSSLHGEEFRVTFLGHEAQHFADLRRWQDLAPWHLEYRAKLVELAQADSTRNRILAKFMEDRKDDPGSPHSYANLRVVHDMTSRLSLRSEFELTEVTTTRLNSAAASLLSADTARLDRQRVAISRRSPTLSR